MPGLPSAQDLIETARTAMHHAHSDPAKAASRALDRWKPAIDQLTDQAGAAVFLGYTGGAGTVRRKRFRELADGTPEWPEPDRVFGRSPVWSYRKIILHLARAPGRGHPGATLGRDYRTRRQPTSGR